jgi:predicted amidohydrolase YtcJ
MDAPASSLLVLGRVFTADPSLPWAEAVLTDGERIAFVGPADEARRLAPPGVETILVGVDGAAGVVVPGIVDGHAHLLMSGGALLQAPLRGCRSLDEIAAALVHWRARNPGATRVLGLGWLFSAVPDGVPTRQMLDAVVPDLPVFLSASDLHSVWTNTAGLRELGIDDDTPDPIGGRIVRDAEGVATGLLLENAAVEIAWPITNQADDGERDRFVQAIVAAYLSSGTTAAVDMAMNAESLAALVRADARGELPFTVLAHWIVHRAATSADEVDQVRVAAEHAARHGSGRVRVQGIKLIVDGTIDGCTAALLDPYAAGAHGRDPAHPAGGLIWPRDRLEPVVLAADAAGLQIAMHAIGDLAVRTALDVLEVAAERRAAAGDTRERRHRIEHLEYVDPADVGRLAPLGVTASMQPVHCDPAGLENWIEVLGHDHRSERGFAWPEFLAAGTTLAFGTDTPTANHEALANLFIATTRRSPGDPTLPAYRPDFALGVAEAVGHATRDAAWAGFLEHERGMLRAGLAADLVVLDGDPFAGGGDTFLATGVACTVVAGAVRYRAVERPR